jgi:hypothetical protein
MFPKHEISENMTKLNEYALYPKCYITHMSFLILQKNKHALHYQVPTVTGRAVIAQSV